MDKTRIETLGHQVKGAVKENLGKVLGDAKLMTDGAAERAEADTHAGTGTETLAGIDTDRIIGVGRQLAGAMKQGLGGLLGSVKMTADGKAERAAGRAQNEAGSVRDEARDAAAATDPAKDTK
jgi:uncharacterized protein YjbJ (UPF0337 family)